jgi:hypothetical protein
VKEALDVPKKRMTAKPQGKNLIAERLFFLREGGNLQTGEYERERMTQEKLAAEVAVGIEKILSSAAPPKQRQRRNEKEGRINVEIFRREDISKIEAGSRYVRDYELVVLADVFGVEINDLTNREGVKK